nr:immunoglobulin light chain junction region [Mus musculus]NSM02708.1 immunoglobulin light chain junction region [Mus musculus]
CGQSYSYPFTF